ncbi:MAG: alpha-glucosidase family protein [Rhizobiaceae bacterium]
MNTQITKSDLKWWRGATIYQIYPRSFQDSNDDGIGDLNGITSRLPAIAALGVDAIWISPFFKSPMKDFGYDVSDYCDVDGIFGNLEDFDALVAKSHELGIKLIIDLVISHTADIHPWFKESRSSRDNAKADWFVWAEPKDDGTPPNNWMSIFGGSSWEWDTRRRQYYLHNFLASQPDLNFHNGEVQDAVLDVARFWLERGVDGFRLDTVNFYFHDKKLRSNPPASISGANSIPDVNPYGRQKHLYDKTQPENIAFLKRFRALLDEYGAMAVGEVGDEDRSLKTMADYTAGDDMLQLCYSFELLGPQFDPDHFRATLEGFNKAAKDSWPCWAFSNHDVRRHISRWAQDGDTAATAKLAFSILAALRGSICLYQGEELGLTEADLTFEQLQDPYGIRFWPDFKGRDGCRTPYPWASNEANAGFTNGEPWLPISAEHAALSHTQQDRDEASVLSHYGRAIKARQSSSALLQGDIKFLDAAHNILAFERFDETERRLCVFNFSSETKRYTVPHAYNASGFVDAFTHGAVHSDATLEIAPFGFAMLQC